MVSMNLYVQYCVGEYEYHLRGGTKGRWGWLTCTSHPGNHLHMRASVSGFAGFLRNINM